MHLYKHREIKSLSGLVSEHSAKLTSRLYNSVNFPRILTNEMSKSKLALLPTGGGGGFLSHTTIILAATLKLLELWLPNFVTYCFYLFGTI